MSGSPHLRTPEYLSYCHLCYQTVCLKTSSVHTGSNHKLYEWPKHTPSVLIHILRKVTNKNLEAKLTVIKSSRSAPIEFYIVIGLAKFLKNFDLESTIFKNIINYELRQAHTRLLSLIKKQQILFKFESTLRPNIYIGPGD